MPKVLVTTPCRVNFGDDRGAVHVADAETPTVTTDVARALVGAGRAMYVDPKDDPSKTKHDTAPEATLALAAQVLKDRKKA